MGLKSLHKLKVVKEEFKIRDKMSGYFLHIKTLLSLYIFEVNTLNEIIQTVEL